MIDSGFYKIYLPTQIYFHLWQIKKATSMKESTWLPKNLYSHVMHVLCPIKAVENL